MVRKLEFRRSGCITIVIIQHSAKTFATRNQTCGAVIYVGSDEAIADPLVISLVMMRHELLYGSAERMLSEEYQAV